MHSHTYYILYCKTHIFTAHAHILTLTCSYLILYFIQVNKDLMVVPLAGAGGQLAVLEVLRQH